MVERPIVHATLRHAPARAVPVVVVMLASLLLLHPPGATGNTDLTGTSRVTLDVELTDFKGRPVPGATAALLRWTGTGEPDATATVGWSYQGAAMADAAGRLAFDLVAPPSGSDELLLRLDPPWDQSGQLPPRDPVRLTLDADGTLRSGDAAAPDLLVVAFDRPNVVVALVDEDGTPLVDVPVVWYAAELPGDLDDGPIWEFQRSLGSTDEDGEFLLHVTAEDGREHLLVLQVGRDDDLPALEHRFVLGVDGTVDHGDATVVDGTVRLTGRLPNLMVNVVTAQGGPVADASVWVEQRPMSVRRGGWLGADNVAQASFGVPHRSTSEDGAARFRLDLPAAPDSDVEYRLRVSPGAAPPFEQRFTVRTDGTLSFRPGERLVDHGDGEVTVALWDTELPDDHPDPAWLLRLNEVRADAGLHPLVERPDWNRAALRHGWYATRNHSFAHEEDPALPGHSLEGQWATGTGNLYSVAPQRSEESIEAWLRSPGHAGWMLDPRVTEVGYGGFVDRRAGSISVLPIVGSLGTFEPPSRRSYPQPDGTLHVAEDGLYVPFGHGTHLLYLWRDDLLDQPLDGQGHPAGLAARARIDGAPVAVEATYGTFWQNVVITFSEALTPGLDVEVTVTLDGEVFDAWSFRTAAAKELPPPDLPRSFADVGPDATHYHGIEAVAGASIAGGFPDGTYRPGAPVTRAQMATFLVNALWLRDAQLTPGRLPADVDDGHVHADAIALLLSSGTAGGFPDGTYRPNAAVTRGQMATFLAAGLDLDTEVELPADRAPSDDGGVHAASIAAVIEEGIASGYPDGTYRPGEPVTRGQMATFLRRALLLP